MHVCVSQSYHEPTITLIIIFSAGSMHSTFQHYENYPIEMKLPGEYQLDFSAFYDSIVWCLQQ